VPQETEHKEPVDDSQKDQPHPPADEAPKSSPELKVDRLKFALFLAAILLFALIASGIKEALGG